MSNRQGGETLGAEAARVLDAVLERRHSCRSFLPDEVPEVLIDEILRAAGRSASWCNTQPWTVSLLRGEALSRLSAELLEVAGRSPTSGTFEAGPAPVYRGESLQRRREAGWALYGAVGAQRGDREATARQATENFRFFGAPHLAVVAVDSALGVYGMADCGAFVSTFLLAAEARGVATIAQAAVVSHPEVVRRHLDLPAGRTLVCGIAFGHRDEAHPANAFRTSRIALEDFRRYLS